MDELIDILDSDGKYTGGTAMKSEAHHLGLFHATIHVWFYTNKGELLIQQRGSHKDTHPLLWDVSVAGHVGAGEDIITAALREIKEEIGLTVCEKDLGKIGVFKSVQKHPKGLMDCEFHHTFLCELKIPLTSLKKQESEVEALGLIPLTKFTKDIQSLTNPKKYVPHKKAYYKTVIKAIRDRL